MALAGHGGGVTAEAADVVLLVDELMRVSEAIVISRRTMRVARQSIWIGLGLSGMAMLVAAGGMIPPVVGALVQEVIDVAVIANALRASSEGQRGGQGRGRGRGKGARWTAGEDGAIDNTRAPMSASSGRTEPCLARP
jgi:hypothetical protein